MLWKVLEFGPRVVDPTIPYSNFNILRKARLMPLEFPLIYRFSYSCAQRSAGFGHTKMNSQDICIAQAKALTHTRVMNIAHVEVTS